LLPNTELGNDVKKPLAQVIQYLNPILPGWSEMLELTALLPKG
jgi:hypothetical protein